MSDEPMIDDPCPVCGHRVLWHPKTLVDDGKPGHFAWARRLCNGVVVRTLPLPLLHDEETHGTP